MNGSLLSSWSGSSYKKTMKKDGDKKMNHSQRQYKRTTGLEHLDAKSQENRIRIRQLIVEKCELAKKLPTRQRVMFLMYYDHGHTIKEIADLCGITEGQVTRRLDGIAEKINNMSGDEDK